MTRIISLQDSSQNLEMNINALLDIANNDIAKLKTQEIYHNRQVYADAETQEIKKKIQECYDLIKDEIKPEISQIFQHLKTATNELFAEMDLKYKKIIEATDSEEDKEVTATSSEWSINWASFLSTITHKVAKVFTKVTTAVGSFLNLFGDNDEENQKKAEFYSGIESTLNDADAISMTIEKKELNIMQNLLSVLSNFQTQNKDLNSFQTKVEKMVTTWNESIYNTSIQTDDEEFDSLRGELLEMKAEPINSDDSKIIDNLLLVFRLGELDPNLLANYKGNGSITMDSRAFRKIGQLLRYSILIKKVLKLIINNLVRSVVEVVNSTDTESLADLHLISWKVHNTMANMLQQGRKVTMGFKMGEVLNQWMEKFNNLVNVFVDICLRIQDYNRRESLDNYIRQLNLHVGQNKTGSKALVELKILISCNLVWNVYNRVMHALKMNVFPFADHYLPEMSFLNHLRSEDNLKNAATIAQSKLKFLRKKLALEKVTIIEDHDEYVQTANFSFGQPEGSIYVWKNNVHSEVLERLLSGAKVKLRPILFRNASVNAVKFNKIGLKFRAVDDIMQKQVNEAIRYIDVKMNHSGSNYYKCGERRYRITTKNLKELDFSLLNNAEGTPVRFNQAYAMIRDGDIVLSPYTEWSVKLYSVFGNMLSLSKFKGKVNLHLEAFGTYVSGDSIVCEKTLNKYYEIVN